MALELSHTPTDSLPPLRTTLPIERIGACLDEAARRGQLPGLEHQPGTTARSSAADRTVFSITDFGHPFESRLTGTAVIGERGAEEGTGTTIRMSVKLRPRLPIAFGVLLVATVWPGIWLTDSMMKAYFPSYGIPTWWWYLPLTVPFVPLAWRTAIRRSKATGVAAARELIEKVGAALDAEVIRAGSTSASSGQAGGVQ